MKKIILSAIIISSFALVTKAQTGSILVYGNVGFNSAKTSGDQYSYKTNSFSFNPGVGYQFNNNWTAGVNLGYSSSNASGGYAFSSTVSAGPFIRYAYPLSSIFAVYGQFNANYMHSSTESSPVKTNGFEGTIFPAIGANLKNGFALNFSFGTLGFTTSTSKYSGVSQSSNSFALGFGSGASFGISKNFGGRHKS